MEPRLQRVFEVIAAAGGEARVAGGAVRNALLDEPISDVDLATTLLPAQVTAACKAAGMAVHPTGIEHGTLTVVNQRSVFEVTTLRRDVSTDGRRATVSFTTDWREDALRRDFTINAMYCSSDGKVHDFTDGYRDILRKRIIFVGEARQRIAEDYLRILRFFRFHARYGEGDPDGGGLAACVALKEGMRGLSAERLRQEMLKLLEARGAVATLEVMARTGILAEILPYTDDFSVVARLPTDGILRLMALATDPAGLKARFRLSNDEADRIASVLDVAPPTPALHPREQRALLYRMGEQAWRDSVNMARARARGDQEDWTWQALADLPARWPIPQFPVTGHDLMAAGVLPGPEMGRMMQTLEDWWIASDFQPDRGTLLARIPTLNN
jgi:poly(A) polymerase